jgi:hypothetical protein
VEGVEGILLRGAMPPGPSLHTHMTVMDEDDPAELTYTIPHISCFDHDLLVGGCGDYRATVPDFQNGNGHGRLDRDQVRVAQQILARPPARSSRDGTAVKAHRTLIDTPRSVSRHLRF